MRKLFRTKKRIAVTVGTVALAAALGGAAFAFFTSTGTGTGSAVIGTGGTGISVVGTETTPLVPGTSGTVSFTVSNAGTVPETITNIHFTGATPDTTSASAGCTSAMLDLSMPDVPISPAVTIPAGGGPTALVATGTLTMGNLATSQDDCVSATPSLSFTTS